MSLYCYSLTAVLWRDEAKLFALTSVIGHYSLLPLVYTYAELPVKFLLFILYSSYTYKSLSDLFGIRKCKYYFPLLNGLETVYILGLLPLFLYENLIHDLSQFGTKYPFLPLMLTSVYCALGLMYCSVRYYHLFLKMNVDHHKQKTF
jgi:alpha-1,3-glucosyltransferase